MEENKIYCSHCGALIEDDDYEEVGGEIVCTDCYEHHTTTCDRCGAVIWTDDSYGDEYTTLCRHCYENHYTRCSCCDALLHEDDAYHLDGYDYCSECYRDEVDKSRSIHDYGYKPEPIFYGDSKRYFGVELEIDGAGKDSDNADELLSIANKDEEHIYIKGDGSLDDGMELVTHPMSLDFHKDFQWDEIMKKAIYLGYRSHQTSTCGLHVHVNRDCLGENREEQDETISRILYFVEHHWNELLKFSRRSEYAMNRWASRYGYENSARAILDKAKKGNNGRYAAVNLMNYATIEFRMFRGTLKLNTFLATLELVNAIIDTALYYSEEGLHKLSWTDYAGIVPHKILRKLTQALANAAEKRGTDAAGISYVYNGEVVIYKRPKPAHKIHFNPPEGTTAVMRHTRMATQGDKKLNFNNYPFAGTAGGTSFAFAHNGVLWNDKELRCDKIIPETYIDTDSYIGVQLIEKQEKLDFESLKYMAETVEGNFTFTVLDQNNDLYIIKGSNPMYLLHFKDIGLYVYASTESIMKAALRRLGLHKFSSERVDTVEGDILCIDRYGEITRSEFEPKLYRAKYAAWYDTEDSPFYNLHEEMLIAYCGCYGVDSADVELLLEYGYTCDEIEEMLSDHDLLHEALRDVKFMCGENLYEECYGGYC